VPITVEAGSVREIGFALAMGKKQEEVVEAARRIASPGKYEAERFVERRAISLGLGSEEITQVMASVPDIIYPFTGSGERGAHITPKSGGARDLWPHGISGDVPVIAAKIKTDEELVEAERFIKRHSLLRQCGVKYDLVFLLEDSGDYRRPVHSGIRDMLTDMGLEGFQGAKGGIHLVDGDGDVRAILAAATQVYNGAEQTQRTVADRTPPAEIEKIARAPKPQAGATCAYNAEGEVVIETAGGLPPNTWSQMLTNGRYGYIATESGTGHMWQLNARENKITAWKNDTLETKGSERLTLIREGIEHSLFAEEDGQICRITYGFGYARWEKVIDQGEITVTAFVPKETEARVFLIEGDLRPGDKIAYFAELILGADDKHKAYVVTEKQGQMLTAQNGANGEFPNVTVTLLTGTEPVGYTCDRQTWAKRKLDGKVGAGLDPCFYAVYPGDAPLTIVTGTAGANELLPLTNLDIARQALEQTKTWWQNRIGGVQVQTGVAAMDHLLSGWALYQSLACRVMGRSSVYQCGGAYGFRDQLQDATALIATAPEVAKEILLLAAARQFEEGDVQHWWHPSGLADAADKGVRTRCSDDLLFLPYVLCEYVEKTGDADICKIDVPYIRSPMLEAGEHERYESPTHADRQETLFQHAQRAVELALQRGAGRHGLALMGTGDWNDGMNLVGAGGKGESVWLTWFLAHVLDRFADLSTRMEVHDKAIQYREEARRFAKAADEAWDGAWYRRGYYDDGKTLGSAGDSACQIDAIAQGWSTMTPYSDPQKVKTALHTAITRLFDKQAGIVRLFEPAFSEGTENPGYIRGYAPGLRENGGQYTHGILWLIMGAFRAGLVDEGYEMLKAITPGHHDQAVYRGEPYVLAADVYANEQHTGRAGWTWYTGASGWYWRVAMEDLLGLRLRDGKLFIEPNLPKALQSYKVDWRAGGKTFRIQVEGKQITVNGKPYDGAGLPMFGNKSLSKVTKL